LNLIKLYNLSCTAVQYCGRNSCIAIRTTKFNKEAFGALIRKHCPSLGEIIGIMQNYFVLKKYAAGIQIWILPVPGCQRGK
jgi:hypothetical protein